jgi:peptidoglycan hydrolase CwlO-like protein
MISEKEKKISEKELTIEEKEKTIEANEKTIEETRKAFVEKQTQLTNAIRTLHAGGTDLARLAEIFQLSMAEVRTLLDKD